MKNTYRAAGVSFKISMILFLDALLVVWCRSVDEESVTTAVRWCYLEHEPLSSKVTQTAQNHHSFNISSIKSIYKSTETAKELVQWRRKLGLSIFDTLFCKNCFCAFRGIVNKKVALKLYI